MSTRLCIAYCDLLDVDTGRFMSLSDLNVVYSSLRVAIFVMCYFVPSTIAISSSVKP